MTDGPFTRWLEGSMALEQGKTLVDLVASMPEDLLWRAKKSIDVVLGLYSDEKVTDEEQADSVELVLMVVHRGGASPAEELEESCVHTWVVNFWRALAFEIMRRSGIIDGWGGDDLSKEDGIEAEMSASDLIDWMASERMALIACDNWGSEDEVLFEKAICDAQRDMIAEMGFSPDRIIVSSDGLN